MVLPGGTHRWELAARSGQDPHEAAAHALDVRGADHAGPFGFEFGVDPLDAAQQFPPSCGQVDRPLSPVALRVRYPLATIASTSFDAACLVVPISDASMPGCRVG